jgi:integration host factor subunit alpha
MTLTKEKVIMNVSAQLGLGPGEARAAVEQVLELIKAALARKEDVLISGFGKFTVRQKNSRRGRNPQTREDLLWRARRVVVFKTSSVLRQRLNSPPTARTSAPPAPPPFFR